MVACYKINGLFELFEAFKRDILNELESIKSPPIKIILVLLIDFINDFFVNGLGHWFRNANH